MTYDVIRIIDFDLNKIHYTCELRITTYEDIVYNGDNPIPDRKGYIESIQPIEITTNEPRRIVFPKSKNLWLTLPQILRDKIEEDVACIDDLNEDK